MCFRMLNQHRNDIVSRGPFFINHGDRDTNNLIILLLVLILILKHYYYTLKIRSSWTEIYSLVTESSIICILSREDIMDAGGVFAIYLHEKE